MLSAELLPFSFVNGLIRSTLYFDPEKLHLWTSLVSLKCKQKGDDLGRFRQLDEILFIDGYPGYMQLMSVVENCMQVVSEVKGDYILVLFLFTTSVWKFAMFSYDLSHYWAASWKEIEKFVVDFMFFIMLMIEKCGELIVNHFLVFNSHGLVTSCLCRSWILKILQTWWLKSSTLDVL